MIVEQNKCKSVLCLDGMLPFQFLKSCNLPIFAADGAANPLTEHGIIPKLIIGDLDSVNPEILKKYPHLKIADQDYTDFEKSLRFLQEQNLTPAVVVGINGGALDKILMNINVFIQTDSVFVSEEMVGFTVSGQKTLNLAPSTKISIIGFDNAIVSTEGLKWNLNETSLSFGHFGSYCNRVVNPEVKISANGLILVLIYTQEIQDCGWNS